MTAQVFILTNDPIGDLFIGRHDCGDGDYVECDEGTARQLGATDDDIYEARKGYRITVETFSHDMLSAVLGEE